MPPEATLSDLADDSSIMMEIMFGLPSIDYTYNIEYQVEYSIDALMKGKCRIFINPCEDTRSISPCFSIHSFLAILLLYTSLSSDTMCSVSRRMNEMAGKTTPHSIGSNIRFNQICTIE